MAQFGVTILKHNDEQQYFIIALKSLSNDDRIKMVIWSNHQSEIYTQLLAIYLAEQNFTEELEIPVGVLVIEGTIMHL